MVTREGWTFVIGASLTIVIVYVLSCWWFPFAPCACCKGKGKHHRKDGRVFRDCWWCKGTGRRLRIGRRLWSFLRKVRDGAV